MMVRTEDALIGLTAKTLKYLFYDEPLINSKPSLPFIHSKENFFLRQRKKLRLATSFSQPCLTQGSERYSLVRWTVAECKQRRALINVLSLS